MASLLLFSVHPDFQRHISLLKTMRIDTFYNFIPSFMKDIKDHTYKDTLDHVYLVYDGQSTDVRFG